MSEIRYQHHHDYRFKIIDPTGLYRRGTRLELIVRNLQRAERLGPIVAALRDAMAEKKQGAPSPFNPCPGAPA